MSARKPKRESLVCQHLEKISRAALEKYQAVIRQYVRQRQGVYALYRRDRLYYVGLATELRSRLRQHLNDRHSQSWDSFSVYLTIGDRHLRELECLILRIVKPKGNSLRGNFNNSENLRRRFTREIRAIQDTERQAMFGPISAVPSGCPTPVKATGAPVLSRFVGQPLVLRATYRGKVVKAAVRRDGTIRFNKTVYNSPSGAGSAATGHACDGWRFWEYERAPGDWVKLHVLRK